MHTKSYQIIASILVVGIIVMIPSAFADTAQVNIVPGAGSSKFCSNTATCFTPSILHVSIGDTVTWTNGDNVFHTIVSGLPYDNKTGTIFDSGTILPANTYSFTFYDSGIYKYSEKVNKYMVGEIIVEPAQASPAVPEFGTLASLVVIISITGVIILGRTFMKS